MPNDPQNDHLDSLWKSISNTIPDDTTLPHFVYFAYFVPDQAIEQTARQLLHKHTSAKAIEKIFRKSVGDKHFLRKLMTSSLRFDVAKLVDLILLHDDSVRDKPLSWINFCLGMKIRFQSVPSVFRATELHLIWPEIERQNRIDELKEFRNLKTISVCFTRRNVFPEPGLILPGLEEIRVGGRVKKISPDILRFKSLKKLSFSTMNLEKLPPEVFEIAQLEEFQSTYNLLTTLPEFHAPSSQLKRLDLELNKMTSLPRSLEQLQKLEELILSRNKLQSLPLSIAGLKALRSLDLTDNNVTSLGSDFASLINLESMRCYKNNISHVADEIVSLTNLKVLDLRYNPMAESRLQWLRERMPNTQIMHH